MRHTLQSLERVRTAKFDIREKHYDANWEQTGDSDGVIVRVTAVNLGNDPVFAIVRTHDEDEGTPFFTVHWKADIPAIGFLGAVNKVFMPPGDTGMVFQTVNGGLNDIINFQEGLRRVLRRGDDPIYMHVYFDGYSTDWAKQAPRQTGEVVMNMGDVLSSTMVFHTASGLPLDGVIAFCSTNQHLLQLVALYTATSTMPLPYGILTEALREYPQ